MHLDSDILSLHVKVPTEAVRWVWNAWSDGNPNWSGGPPTADSSTLIRSIEIYNGFISTPQGSICNAWVSLRVVAVFVTHHYPYSPSMVVWDVSYAAMPVLPPSSRYTKLWITRRDRYFLFLFIFNSHHYSPLSPIAIVRSKHRLHSNLHIEGWMSRLVYVQNDIHAILLVQFSVNVPADVRIAVVNRGSDDLEPQLTGKLAALTIHVTTLVHTQEAVFINYDLTEPSAQHLVDHRSSPTDEPVVTPRWISHLFLSQRTQSTQRSIAYHHLLSRPKSPLPGLPRSPASSRPVVILINVICSAVNIPFSHPYYVGLSWHPFQELGMDTPVFSGGKTGLESAFFREVDHVELNVNNDSAHFLMSSSSSIDRSTIDLVLLPLSWRHCVTEKSHAVRHRLLQRYRHVSHIGMNTRWTRILVILSGFWAAKVKAR